MNQIMTARRGLVVDIVNWHEVRFVTSWDAGISPLTGGHCNVVGTDSGAEQSLPASASMALKAIQNHYGY